ncbi:MAG: hypothetical protein ABH823_00440 [bacterium]
MAKKKKQDKQGYLLAGLVGSLIGILSTILSLKAIPALIGKCLGLMKKPPKCCQDIFHKLRRK